MNIEKMFEMQCELDERIIKEHGLEGQDLLPNTVLALQVEIAELANEWRGFKHWSHRQTPEVETEVCDYCGEDVDYTRPSPFLANAGASMCKACWDMTQTEYAASNGEYIPDFEDYPHFVKKVPYKMLMEYVDCLHFFLSVARQIKYPLDDLIHLHAENLEEGPLVYVFIELLQHVGWLALHIHPEVRKRAFEFAFVGFVNLGKRLGFSPEQIEQAYLEKNQINHERQSTGY
ncbi:dUTP diphosphatase [Paenibacillus larvae]|uniref:dUTP diphosphatase n=1 Tax=Paenibacillus larvae TaxID=1464 RepID=UPI002281024A|nr:dUTP diphosphatase [Paenibacillus larvae]MCY9512331.1 dUTP diphosphatase [Paenibacillus larvae]MCY9527027.1 dUTP diphosphatase [Paenibacillus larvae]